MALATDVFGEPVTENVVMGIPEYANRARQIRADVARRWKERDDKYEKALGYVKALKSQWGTGVSTLCLVYNATGEPLTFVTSHDWFGHIYQTYPRVIANGQWGGFLHVKTAGAASGSEAAVVYRGKNKDGRATDWLLAWDNPWRRIDLDNQAYAEIHAAGYFERVDWGAIAKCLEGATSQHYAAWEGCIAYVKTESDTSPLYEAVLSLE
ncbi:23 kDa jasmonate-induced protein-like [Durio zibethinus]|uniref:23 kDa jasmonate-induced protein-like n=1 Tax=Durio zibethinus TaxID=66656 RepID=A0A6P5X3S7_DURZI|nr:23 kDa jasmonate-induced protein-like [Durio zibethinus]